MATTGSMQHDLRPKSLAAATFPRRVKRALENMLTIASTELHRQMQTVLQEARECLVELIVLTVTEGNQAALALYRRAGFAAFGIEPDAVRVHGVSLGKIHMAVQLPGAAAALRAEK